MCSRQFGIITFLNSNCCILKCILKYWVFCFVVIHYYFSIRIPCCIEFESLLFRHFYTSKVRLRRLHYLNSSLKFYLLSISVFFVFVFFLFVLFCFQRYRIFFRLLYHTLHIFYSYIVWLYSLCVPKMKMIWICVSNFWVLSIFNNFCWDEYFLICRF